MPKFFILNEVPSVDATNARDAARAYARERKIEGGEILVATGVKTFVPTATPADVQVTES